MFSPKKILVIAVIVIILIAIPLTLFLLQQQQELRSNAQAASTLSFTPDSSPSTPIQAAVGEPVDLDLYVDPGTNLVSIVRLEVQYDNTKLTTATASGGEAFEKNTLDFPSVREGPIYLDGKMQVTLSIGSDLTKPIQTRTKIGTLHLIAVAKTDTPTQVLYSTQSQVLSLSGPDTGSSDQASENVLSATTPAIINIADTEPSITPDVTEEPTSTPTPGLTEAPTATPTLASNQPPICTTLTATPSAGTAPLNVTFTATGTDSDGQITKFAFNFGDGNLSTVTTDTQTSSNSATAEHSYANGGTFTASVVLTDDKEGSSTNDCSQVITIAGPTATPSAVTATPTLGTDSPTPTLASPGPGATIIGLGAFFSVLSVIGAILFFAL
jgi:hypothetical protein